MASNNIFALLDNEDGGASNTRASKKAAAAPAGKPKAPLSGFPGEQPAGRQVNHSARVPDRKKDTHYTEGGARGGRPAGRGGRGGRGAHADPSVRQFDRRGAPTKHAPNHAARDGAALGPEGGAEAVKAGDSAADVVEIADVDVVEDVVVDAVEIEDPSMTYDEYLASKRLVEDDNRQIREVSNDDSAFNKVKPLVREDEEKTEDESTRRVKAPKAKKVLNLDEFRGGRDADAKYRPQSSGPTRGGFDGARGGRGGRGGFSARGPRPEGDAPRGAPRGGRGGRGGAAPRGGRGGFAPRSNAAPVAINDKAAFPALGQ